MPGLSVKVANHPVFLSELNGRDRKGEQFATSQSAADQESEDGVVTLASENVARRMQQQRAALIGGGLSLDHQQWVHPRYAFFLPVKVLSRVFRGKFTAGLKRAFRKRQLTFPGSLQPLEQGRAFRFFLRSLFRQDWVVYAKIRTGRV